MKTENFKQQADFMPPPEMKRTGKVMAYVDDEAQQEVSAWFFDFEGREMAIVASPKSAGYFYVAEPVSGLKISMTISHSRDAAYDKFVANREEYERTSFAKGMSMLDVIDYAKANPADAVMKCRLDRERNISAQVKDVMGAKL